MSPGFGDLLKGLSDPYDRRARLYPALLVLTPLAVLLVCLYGAQHLLASTVLSILGTCGTAYALSRVARDAGKRLEAPLFAKWGGAPTTHLLRHSDATYDSHTKERYHLILGKGLGKPMPTRDEESADPKSADALYRAGTKWLISQTTDTKRFSLLFKENIAFGFQRNALGLRSVGAAIAAVCLVWTLMHGNIVQLNTPYFDSSAFAGLPPAVIVSLLVSAFMLFAWLVVFREASVQRVGLAYADRLIRSCDELGAASRTSNSVRSRKPKRSEKQAKV